MSSNFELSNLNSHAAEYSIDMSRNAASWMVDGRAFTGKTIFLNEVRKEHFPNKSLDFISVDTEESQYEVLSHFGFKKYRPITASCRHKLRVAQNKTELLVYLQRYERLFRHSTEVDAWYVDHQ
ncbi:hypothetical protein N9C22_04555 [Paracoccaceae bacterium]|nr:hypothetical protein [Paracoccaceae bacterium]